jgi:hypothetical protein
MNHAYATHCLSSNWVVQEVDPSLTFWNYIWDEPNSELVWATRYSEELHVHVLVFPRSVSLEGVAVRHYHLLPYPFLHTLHGRATAQAVSRRLPTTAARVPAQVKSCGICGGHSGTGAGFLRVLRFPLTILLPLIAPHSSSIIRGWYNRPDSGRRTKWTQSQPTPKNYKKTTQY